ncbi:AzlD domain-containing protein [Treponema sp. OMZ 840]|uniref:branched-chain amino acid transporter permease n=1 Tax=Treponema sp. OMZ 840 TaxID=244313 RepID=UPI003D8FBD8D
MLTLNQALIAIVLMALIIFATRLFSFALFSKRTAPPLFRYLGTYFPSLVITVLIIYTLKDIDFAQRASYIPALGAICFTVLAHLYKGNAMISIFGGTIIYMVLI